MSAAVARRAGRRARGAPCAVRKVVQQKLTFLYKSGDQITNLLFCSWAIVCRDKNKGTGLKTPPHSTADRHAGAARRRGVAALALLAFMCSSVPARAEALQVLHWWTSGGEAAAVKELFPEFELDMKPITRPWSSAPSVGSFMVHKDQEDALLSAALD